MTWAIVIGGIVLVGAAAIAAIVSPAKFVAGLLGTGLIVSAIFATLAITSSVRSSPMGGFSHAQLEADRIMTQQMATVVGPGMQSQMGAGSMLQRSANEAYLEALEQHTYQVDRMLGRGP